MMVMKMVAVMMVAIMLVMIVTTMVMTTVPSNARYFVFFPVVVKSSSESFGHNDANGCLLLVMLGDCPQHAEVCRLTPSIGTHRLQWYCHPGTKISLLFVMLVPRTRPVSTASAPMVRPMSFHPVLQ